MERDIPHAIVEDLDRSSSLPCPRLDPARRDFAQAVLAGFATKPRSLPCRFFYGTIHWGCRWNMLSSKKVIASLG